MFVLMFLGWRTGRRVRDSQTRRHSTSRRTYDDTTPDEEVYAIGTRAEGKMTEAVRAHRCDSLCSSFAGRRPTIATRFQTVTTNDDIYQSFSLITLQRYFPFVRSLGGRRASIVSRIFPSCE